MVDTSILKSWEKMPNAGLKSVFIIAPNTTDQNDTITLTLTDYGISATGLLSVKGWVHTTDGSVIVVATQTTAVTTGSLVITCATAHDNSTRVFELVGRPDLGVFE